MTVIVDAVYVLALAMQFPNGDIPTAAVTYPNRAECVAARSQKIADAQKFLAGTTDNVSFFIGECTALPVGQVVKVN